MTTTDVSAPALDSPRVLDRIQTLDKAGLALVAISRTLIELDTELECQPRPGQRDPRDWYNPWLRSGLQTALEVLGSVVGQQVAELLDEATPAEAPH
jgi:hypothetical protein